MKITTEQKKEFIRWFLNRYQLKRRESVWILNYLGERFENLDKVHFVEYAQYCPRGLIMSTACTELVAFRYYKDKVMTTDAEKSFHDIRLSRDEDLYITLHFKDDMKTPTYLDILENNPHYKDPQLDEQYSKPAEDILRHTLQKMTERGLMKAIDKALDEKDEESFMILSAQYKKIKEKKRVVFS